MAHGNMGTLFRNPLFIILAGLLAISLGLATWKLPHIRYQLWLRSLHLHSLRIPVARKTNPEVSPIAIQCGCIALELPNETASSVQVEAIHDRKLGIVGYRVDAPQAHFRILRPVTLDDPYFRALQGVQIDPAKSFVEFKAEQYDFTVDEFSWFLSRRELADLHRRTTIALATRLRHAVEVEVLTSDGKECLLVWEDETGEFGYCAELIDHTSKMALAVFGDRESGVNDPESVRCLLMSVTIALSGTPCVDLERVSVE